MKKSRSFSDMRECYRTLESSTDVRERLWLVSVAAAVTAIQVIAYAGLVASMIRTGNTRDFALFYADARTAVVERQNPYAPGADEAASHASVNLNPPQFLILFAPLVALDPQSAFLVWIAVGALSAIAAIRLILRELGLRATRPAGLAFVAGVLASASTGALLLSAQVSWVLWWPVTWAWAAARRGRWIAAGAVLGVLASLKPFLVLPAILFACARQWRSIAAFVLTMAASYSAGLAAFGWETFHSWLTGLGQITWGRSVLNASTLGALERALVDRPAPVWDVQPLADASRIVGPLWLVASVAVLGMSVRAIRRSSRLTTTEADSIFAIGVPAALLVSPVGWIYYDMWFAGAVLALGLTERWWDSRIRRVLIALFGVPLVLAPGMLAAGQPNGWLTVTLGSSYFWSLLALWICLVLPINRSPEPSAI